MSYVNSSLYVGDLQPEINEALLYEVFREIGPIVSIKVCRDVMTSKSLGYAYVNFQNAEDAANAIERLNFNEVKGKPIRIMYVQRDPAVRKSGAGNIFIKNLDESIDNKTLYDTFSLFGNILSCKVSSKRFEVIGSDGKPEVKEQRLGYGFVHFDSEEAADMAIQKVNGMLIAGKQVEVTKFIRKLERTKGSEEKLYTNIFIKDLDASVDDKTLQKFYEKFGETTSCIVMKDKDGKSKQFGFINFKDATSAPKAVEETHGKIIEGISAKGVPLYVGKAEKKEDRVNKLRTEYEKKKQESIQKYQDDSIDDGKLKALFDEFGKITSCVVMKDESGVSKGFGFICFSTPEESTKAITEMHTKIILNKPLYVTLAQRKENRRQELEQQYKQRQQGIIRPGMQQMYPGPQVFYGQPMQRQMIYPNQMGGNTKPRWTQGQQQNQKTQKPGGKKQHNKQGGQKPTKQTTTTTNTTQTTQQGGDVKYKDNVRNKQQPVKQKPVQQVQQVQQQSGTLDATYLANLSPRSQKQTLGETLFPMVHQQQPDLASKITGMLLEMDNGDILHLLESSDALNAKVAEAVNVLKHHQEEFGKDE